MQCLVPFVQQAFVYSGGTTVYNGGSTMVVLLVLFIEYSNIHSFWGYSIRLDLEYSF